MYSIPVVFGKDNPHFTERRITGTGGLSAKERTYTESGKVVFKEAADYSLIKHKGGIENFRIKAGDPPHEVFIDQNDKLVIEPPSLK